MLITACLSINSYAQVSFKSPIIYKTGSWAEVLAVGDINSDKKNDVILGTAQYGDPSNDFCIFIYLQDSTGNLIQSHKIKYGASSIRCIDIGDLNGDSKNDLAIGYGDSVRILQQNPTGTLFLLEPLYSGKSVDGLSIGDVDGDGKNDIAVSHWNDPFIKIFYSDDSGLTPISYGAQNAGWDQILIARLGDDTENSVIYMRGQGMLDDLTVFKINSQRTTDTIFSMNSLSGRGFDVGDIDGDGGNEIVMSVGSNNNSGLAIWKKFLYAPDTILPRPWANFESVKIKNLDCETEREISTFASCCNNLFIESFKDTTIKVTVPYQSHVWPQGLCVADINSDGLSDFLLANYNVGLVVILNDSELATDTVVLDTIREVRTIGTHEEFAVNIRSDTTDSCIITITDSSFVRTDTLSIHTYVKMQAHSINICGDTVKKEIFKIVLSDSIIILTDTIHKFSVDTQFVDTGIHDVESDDFSFFPNPARDYVKIKSKIPLHGFLFDFKGDKVCDFQTQENKYTLNVIHLARGNYILVIGCSAKKLVLE